MLWFTEIWQRSLWFFWESSALRRATSRLQKHTPMPCRVGPPGCGNSPQISPTCQLCIPNAACPWKLHKGGVSAMFAGQDFCTNGPWSCRIVEKAIRMLSNAMAPSTERHPDLSVSPIRTFPGLLQLPQSRPRWICSVSKRGDEHRREIQAVPFDSCCFTRTWHVHSWWMLIIQGKSLNLWTFLQQFVVHLILNA